MRLALPALAVLALLSACSAGGGGSSTGGSGSGTLCSPCTQDSNCIAGGGCVFETSPTQGYCAAPCVDSFCADPGTECFDLGGGAGQLSCYPVTKTCVGYTSGDSTGTTGAAGAGATSSMRP